MTSHKREMNLLESIKNIKGKEMTTLHNITKEDFYHHDQMDSYIVGHKGEFEFIIRIDDEEESPKIATIIRNDELKWFDENKSYITKYSSTEDFDNCIKYINNLISEYNLTLNLSEDDFKKLLDN